jgi:hypothetical protein
MRTERPQGIWRRLDPYRTGPSAQAARGAAAYAVGHRGIAVNPTGLFGSWNANWLGVPV